MNDILHCDNFSPDLPNMREAVLRSEFGTHKGPDGATYTGISMYPVPHFYELIAQLRGKRIIPRLSCFRLNLAGELPHSWVHSDDICAKWATVLYLNTPEQCKGGTAFWKHKTRGIDRLPSKAELAAKGEDADAIHKAIEQEWKELAHWEQVQFVPMQFNRFITYPTSLFHSRFPFEGFGKGPEDGRLIWICFYDIEGEA